MSGFVTVVVLDDGETFNTIELDQKVTFAAITEEAFDRMVNGESAFRDLRDDEILMRRDLQSYIEHADMALEIASLAVFELDDGHVDRKQRSKRALSKAAEALRKVMGTLNCRAGHSVGLTDKEFDAFDAYLSKNEKEAAC